jgi:hypothetical protein
VPRAKYTKPPGPLPAIDRVQRSEFRFRHDQWRKLKKLLPSELDQLAVPSNYTDETERMPHRPSRKLKTIADAVVHHTEGAISSHLTVERLYPEYRMPTAANVRAAIWRLRTALKPFVYVWVDTETADLIPAGLDDALAARERELAKLRLPPARYRALGMLCQTIQDGVKEVVAMKHATISDHNIIRYVDFALTCAAIDHPDSAKHRDRLAALVFPKD